MAKEPIRYKYQSRRKHEYSKEGLALLKEFQPAARGRSGEEINPVILGGRKRGHGRGKASNAGPSKKRVA